MDMQAIGVVLRTLLKQEFLRFARIWVQTLLPPAITTALYFIIFGELIGVQIADIAGHRYIDYIAPGLVLMSVIVNAYANVVSSFFSAKFQLHIEEMLVAPIPNLVLLAGFIGGGVLRGLAVGLVVLAVTAFFIDIAILNLGLTALAALLTSILFALGGFINAIYARTFDDISIIPTFVLMPLTYLGGIFYSIEMLPEFWQSVSLGNPILHMIGLFRYGWLGIEEVNIIGSLVMICTCIVGLTGYCLWLLARGTGLRK